jgi:hypothetical protein
VIDRRVGWNARERFACRGCGGRGTNRGDGAGPGGGAGARAGRRAAEVPAAVEEPEPPRPAVTAAATEPVVAASDPEEIPTELAHEGREDQAAVAELSAVANGRRRALRRAERASRQTGCTASHAPLTACIGC